MDNSWDKYDPAPIEFLHGQLMELFHEYRRSSVGQEAISVCLDGGTLGNLIARAKQLTYEKYPGESMPRPKAVAFRDIPPRLS